MASKKFRTPKGCIVRSVALTRSGADLSLDCGGESGAGRGWFPSPSGGGSNYQHVAVKGVRSVSVDGATVSGDDARVGFVLSPRSATCRTDGATLNCTVK